MNASIMDPVPTMDDEGLEGETFCVMETDVFFSDRM